MNALSVNTIFRCIIRISKYFVLGPLLLFLLTPISAGATTHDFYAGFHDLPPSIHLYRFKGHPKKILLFITALPQLYVFNESGQELLEHTGGYDNPARAFSRVFLHPIVAGNHTLTQQMHSIVPVDTRSGTALASRVQFTVVEYWAPWCEYCFEERDQLLMFFRAHPTISVNWITVDADNH